MIVLDFGLTTEERDGALMPGPPNDVMGFMMDILSCQGRKSTGDLNDGCFSLGELVPFVGHTEDTETLCGTNIHILLAHRPLAILDKGKNVFGP